MYLAHVNNSVELMFTYIRSALLSLFCLYVNILRATRNQSQIPCVRKHTLANKAESDFPPEATEDIIQLLQATNDDFSGLTL